MINLNKEEIQRMAEAIRLESNRVYHETRSHDSNCVCTDCYFRRTGPAAMSALDTIASVLHVQDGRKR